MNQNDMVKQKKINEFETCKDVGMESKQVKWLTGKIVVNELNWNG